MFSGFFSLSFAEQLLFTILVSIPWAFWLIFRLCEIIWDWKLLILSHENDVQNPSLRPFFPSLPHIWSHIQNISTLYFFFTLVAHASNTALHHSRSLSLSISQAGCYLFKILLCYCAAFRFVHIRRFILGMCISNVLFQWIRKLSLSLYLYLTTYGSSQI